VEWWRWFVVVAFLHFILAELPPYFLFDDWHLLLPPSVLTATADQVDDVDSEEYVTLGKVAWLYSSTL
jgi:hypothetical protein